MGVERFAPVLARAGIVLWAWEPGAGRMAGSGSQEEPGEGVVPLAEILEAVHPADLPGLTRTLALARAGEAGELSLRFRLRDGAGGVRWVWCRGWREEVPGREGRLLGVLTGSGVPRDPTDPPPPLVDGSRAVSELLERRVRERTVELDVALRGQEALTYSIAHDLRPPLRAIHGYAALLKSRGAPATDPEAAALLSAIERNALTMAHLMDDLLELSNVTLHRLDPREVDLGELVQAVVRGIQAREGERVRFDVGPLPTVTGDPVLLRQALSHLLDNAVKFSGPRERPLVSVTGEEGQVGATVVVRDNGIGFDQRYAERLFGVFERLHPAEGFPGNGMGLAVVERILRRHGGRISAHGETGGGAEFTVTLPRYEGVDA